MNVCKYEIKKQDRNIANMDLMFRLKQRSSQNNNTNFLSQ
jgi:hypothetical protein